MTSLLPHTVAQLITSFFEVVHFLKFGPIFVSSYSSERKSNHKNNLVAQILGQKSPFGELCNFFRKKWGHANNDTPNTSPWCGGGAWSWPTWAQTISMASCLINNSGNSANTDSIRQAKEQSYPWTNKQIGRIERETVRSNHPWETMIACTATLSAIRYNEGLLMRLDSQNGLWVKGHAY